MSSLFRMGYIFPLYIFYHFSTILQYLRLVATPSDGHVRTQAEIEHNELLDFQMISHEGQLPNSRVKRNPFEHRRTWNLKMRRDYAYEHHDRFFIYFLKFRIRKAAFFMPIKSHLIILQTHKNLI